MTFEELNDKTLEWASARGILAHSSPTTQFIKLVEETGELAAGLARHNDELVADALGDVVVVLILLAKLAGMDLLTCLHGAFDEIKDRKGFINSSGVFVKEADAPAFTLSEGASHD